VKDSQTRSKGYNLRSIEKYDEAVNIGQKDDGFQHVARAQG
jgi:hypothetical protein